MNTTRILTAAICAAAITSCAPKSKLNGASTGYGYPDASYGDAPADASLADANPLYDTPAAYDASTTTPDTTPVAPAGSHTTKPAATHTTTPAVSHSAPSQSLTHTVAKGDTLSKISTKYHVSAAAIKLANHMKNDTVVLGKKMIIPAR